MDVILAHDPLCGWCFGSIVESNRLVDLLSANGLTFDVRCGGLVTGERVRALHHDADYLRAGLARVREVTGQRAGHRFLDGLLGEGTFVSDSEPLCRLLWCTRSYGPKVVLGVGHELSSAFYRLGLPPTDVDVVVHALQSQGLDAQPILDAWDAPLAREGAAAWMSGARALGVTTYPSVLARTSSRTDNTPIYETVSNGFESAATTFGRLQLILNVD